MSLDVEGGQAIAPRACVCYVVDEKYLFPTLVSALQARRHTNPARTDVTIVCLGELTTQVEVFCEAARSGGVDLIVAPLDRIGRLHVMFGRFFLNALLPRAYERLLYIDGDTQVARSLEPLLTVTLPPGHVAAARDPVTRFCSLSPRWSARHADHCASVGFAGRPADYVNSGVLLIDPTDWDDIGRACLDAYREAGPKFLHPDQDALNVAARDRIVLMSERWNFAGFLIGSPSERAFRPHIYHFMSNPRPWVTAAPPWGRKWSQPYDDLGRLYPELPRGRPQSLAKRLRFALQQRLKQVTEYGPVGRTAAEPAVVVG